MYQSIRNIRHLILGITLLCFAAPGFASTAIHDVVLLNTQALTTLSEAVAKQPSSYIEPSSDIGLSLSAMGQDFNLLLRPSRMNAMAMQHTKQDNPTVYFDGHIAGDEQSWARISVQGEKLNGHFYYSGTFYQLEHREYLASLSLTYNGNSDHVLFEPGATDDGRKLLAGFAAQTDYLSFAPTNHVRNNIGFDALLKQQQLGYWKTDLSQNAEPEVLQAAQAQAVLKQDHEGFYVTRALRVGIYIDSRFNDAHRQRGLARALTIMAAVDAIYQQQLGIAVIVENIQNYEDAQTDPMRDKGGKIGEILDNFREVRLQETNLPTDLSLAHLFTGHKDPDSVIGLGWKGTLCRLDGYDISASTPFPFDTLLAAHEIAHNLGAVHDGDPQCEAEGDAPQDTLMWPEISGNSTSTFSNCSLVAMQEAKSRSCNWDNIDAAINIRTYPSSEALSRSVVVEVSNNDQLGRSTELFSATRFPPGTQFSDLSAGCVISGTNIECNHGRVQAAGSSSIAVSATLPNAFSENIVTSVELVNATDTYSSDNRKAILMLQSIDATDQLFATDPLALGDEQSTSNDDFITQLGNPSTWLLLGLATILGVRTRRFFTALS